MFSKLLTDADTYWITDNPRAADQYNRRLEKSIGSYDVTHNFKFAGVFDLPFGKGRRWAKNGIANAVVGGWRASLIALYSGGRPIGLSTSVGTPLFAGRGVPVVTTYDNWAGTVEGRQVRSRTWTSSSSRRRISARSPASVSATRRV